MRKKEEDDLAEVLRRVKDLQAAIFDLKTAVDMHFDTLPPDAVAKALKDWERRNGPVR